MCCTLAALKDLSKVDMSGYLIKKVPDRRSRFKKIVDVVVTIFKDISFFFRMLGPFFRYCNSKTRKVEYLSWSKDSAGVVHYDLSKISARQNSVGAVFFIQGLNGYPFIWESYIDKIQKQNPDIDCFALDIYKSGNCRLKEAVKPVFEAVEQYLKQDHKLSAVLAGMSMGGLGAAKVERLLEDKQNRIKTILMASPVGGTKFMDWAIALGLAKFFNMHSSVQEGLKFGSPIAKNRIEKWRVSAQNAAGERKREFFGSINDDRLFPRETAFPRISTSDAYRFYTRESHLSTLDSVISDDVVKSALDWFS